jgi:hypothetical protein
MHKRNKITIVIEDVDPEAGTIRYQSSFDTMPDIEKGPQTPAELIAARAMHFLVTQAMYADKSNDPSIIMPEDYINSDINSAEMLGELVRINERKRH